MEFNSVSSNQNNKYTTINDFLNQLDSIIGDVKTYTVDNTDTVTVSKSDFLNFGVYVLSPSGGSPPTGLIDVNLPVGGRPPFVVINETLEEAYLRHAGQTDMKRVVEPGECAIFYTDGTSVQTFHGAEGSGGGNSGWAKVELVDVATPQSEITFALPADTIAIHCLGWLKVATDAAAVELNFSNDGGTTFETGSDYSYNERPKQTDGTDGTSSTSTADTKILIAQDVGSGTDEKCALDMCIKDARDTGYTSVTLKNFYLDSTATPLGNRSTGGGMYEVAEAVDYARLKADSGNISGKFLVMTLSDQPTGNEVAAVEGEEFHLEATSSSSYGGSGETWSNIVASPASAGPADQTHYDAYLGATGTADGDEPTFNGTAGTSGADFTLDGTNDIFDQINSGDEKSRWLATLLRDDVGDNPFTLAVALKTHSSLGADVVFSINAGGNQRFNFETRSGGAIRIERTSEHNVTRNTDVGSLSTSSDYLIFITGNFGANGNTGNYSINSRTYTTWTMSAGAPSDLTNLNMKFEIGHQAGSNFFTGDIKAVKMWNYELSEAQMSTEVTAFNSAHDVTYVA